MPYLSRIIFIAFLLTLSVSLTIASGSLADSVLAVIHGRIVDQNDAVVVGAAIVATNTITKAQTSSSSDTNGEFTFTLEPGDYLLTAEAEGFNSLSKPLHVSPAEKNAIELSLEIASATATVTVTDGGEYQTATVFSATKIPTAARDVPQSLSIVGSQQIKDQLFSGISEITRYQPGITAGQGEGNRDQVVIRGQDTTADFYVNGIRDDVQYFRDLYNLERVETLRGPNALTFGRGGGGGVINRVTKEAQFSPLYEFTLQGGSYANRRGTFDINKTLGKKVAVRFNGMAEASDTFRDFVDLDRYGFNPTVTIVPDSKTRINIAYEFFRDRRTADRGIPSFGHKPVDVPASTFYGDPSNSKVWANVHMLNAGIERDFGGLIVRNRTLYGDYDKFYQNYVPGVVNAAEMVSISAYNNHTRRRNLFNQTDLFYNLSTGPIRHSLVGGFEFGRQRSNNFRNTGFFNNTATSILLPVYDPTVTTPITFRQSVSDGDNHSDLNLAAAYLQDQIQINRYVKVIGGLRFDYFDLKFHNNRNGAEFRRIDQLVSPRLGVVVKPVESLSLYASYSVSYLPSGGDQFSTLAANTETLKPEKFQNYEVGIKWDIRPTLSFTSAVYRLDRTNTRANDPDRSGFFIQTGAHRANGFEASLSGTVLRNWTMTGSYSFQDAFISRTTSSAQAGTRLGQVPRHSFSVWNKYQIARPLGIGVGIIRRSDMFAAVNNPNATPSPVLATVLPAYTRVDAAVFYSFNEHWRLQGNVENLLDAKYYQNAHNNTNISPGSPRAAKVALVVKF